MARFYDWSQLDRRGAPHPDVKRQSLGAYTVLQMQRFLSGFETAPQRQVPNSTET